MNFTRCGSFRAVSASASRLRLLVAVMRRSTPRRSRMRIATKNGRMELEQPFLVELREGARNSSCSFGRTSMNNSALAALCAPPSHLREEPRAAQRPMGHRSPWRLHRHLRFFAIAHRKNPGLDLCLSASIRRMKQPPRSFCYGRPAPRYQSFWNGLMLYRRCSRTSAPAPAAAAFLGNIRCCQGASATSREPPLQRIEIPHCPEHRSDEHMRRPGRASRDTPQISPRDARGGYA